MSELALGDRFDPERQTEQRSRGAELWSQTTPVTRAEILHCFRQRRMSECSTKSSTRSDFLTNLI